MLEIALAFGMAIVSFLTAGFMLAFLLVFVIRSIQAPDDYHGAVVYTPDEPDDDGPDETDLEDYYRAIRQGKAQ